MSGDFKTDVRAKIKLKILDGVLFCQTGTKTILNECFGFIKYEKNTLTSSLKTMKDSTLDSCANLKSKINLANTLNRYNDLKNICISDLLVDFSKKVLLIL